MPPALDAAKKDAFERKMLDMLNHAGLALMTSLGHRAGLFDAMAGMPAAASRQIAERTKLSERYVREWLGAMVTAGVVEHQSSGDLYRLPPEHAGMLTRTASPNNIAVAAQWIAVLGFVEDRVLEAFRHGGGVPYEAYHRFHEVMAEESAQTVVAALEPHILPLVPGLRERLAQGIDVLDVGCGSGLAMMGLAQRFPASRFAGYDFSAEAVAAARAQANDRGLKNVRFEAKDVAEMNEPGAYDLITAFDAIHDQARPERVLKSIATALRPGGAFLMQDISSSSHVHQDIGHPIGTFLYTVSCMHCMSVSLANGGPGLGAMWGRERATAMLREAGFRQVRIESLPHDVINDYYVATM
jgi:2-polyprenyl-3-methyl-5-hydroxy-6-metoxy-1,4-benzoquinol methylase